MNRGAWIIAVSIVLAAVIVVGAQFYFRAQDRECKEWQGAVRWIEDARAELVLHDDIDLANDALGETSEARPAGCPRFP